jgi:hypothetical protein
MLNKIIKLIGITLIGTGLFASMPFVGYAQYYSQTYPYATYYTGNYSPLYVTTATADNITSSSVVLSGQINGNNLYSTYNMTTWFQYGTSTNLELSTVQISSNSGYASFNATVAGLYPNTVYYYRAVAQNQQGVVYGNTNSFRTNYADVVNNGVYNYNNVYNTSPQALTAITQPATNVSSESVDLNSLILNSSQDSNTFSWFEYGTSLNLGNATTLVSTGGLPSVRQVNSMDGLMPGTTYYFRAVVQNPYTKTNGATLSFTTIGIRPSIITSTPTITSTDTITKTTPPASTPTTPAIKTATPTDTSGTNTPSNSPTSQLGASVAGIGSFLPNSLFSWMILLILILLLFVLGKHLHGQFKK